MSTAPRGTLVGRYKLVGKQWIDPATGREVVLTGGAFDCYEISPGLYDVYRSEAAPAPSLN